jgi:hypothetical protein
MPVQTRRSPGRKNKYVVRWRVKGKEVSRIFSRFADARRFDVGVPQSLNTDSYVDANAGKITEKRRQ